MRKLRFGAAEPPEGGLPAREWRSWIHTLSDPEPSACPFYSLPLSVNRATDQR